ncbi:hypothetical protein [Paenibacillus sp. NPDC058071]|uniref:hypothetical protein n=1 Tax=Paenibacillus sp. NPDC058071 TaxID=3346326 RepID=UPI0036D81051
MKNRYDGLRRELWSMPDGKRKLAVMEETIRIADQHMNVQEAYEARMEYTSAALESGCPERLYISFSWCLAQYDRDPGGYSSLEIMWQYKWVLNHLWRMPQLGLDFIERVFDDFRDRCGKLGFTLRAYHQQKVNFLLSQGHMKEAADEFRLWRGTPRDSLSDCRACEQNLFAEYYFRINHNKKGLQTLKPILEGKLSCRAVPQNSYSQLMMPLLKLGEYDQAAETAKKAYRLLNGPQYLIEYSVFIEFFTIMDMPKAVKLYERTIQLGLDSKLPWDRFRYFLSVRLFLREWSKKKRRKRLAHSEQVTLEWLDGEIDRHIGAFNERNGNDYMDRYIAEKEQFVHRLADKRDGGTFGKP